MSSYRCDNCGHTYDEETGDPREGFGPGTLWSQLPDDWFCPDCAVRDKVDFVPLAGSGVDDGVEDGADDGAGA